jgi:hypothetical protein
MSRQHGHSTSRQTLSPLYIIWHLFCSMYCSHSQWTTACVCLLVLFFLYFICMYSNICAYLPALLWYLYISVCIACFFSCFECHVWFPLVLNVILINHQRCIFIGSPLFSKFAYIYVHYILLCIFNLEALLDKAEC